MRTKPIGVFDSGVGGISVLRELVQLMPQEQYLYYGDSANAPYGAKTTQQVQSLTLDAAQMLLQRGVKALVIACNTATAAAIELLRQQYPDTIIVGIEPAVKPAANAFPTGNIGIMATQVTLREKRLAALLDRFPHARFHRIPVPGLVELVEAGKANSPEAETLLRQCLAPYVGKLDALVLGCTHYPFARNTISAIMGSSTQLFDGGQGTARQTRFCLEHAGLLHTGDGSVQFENSLAEPEILTRCMRLFEKG